MKALLSQVNKVQVMTVTCTYQTLQEIAVSKLEIIEKQFGICIKLTQRQEGRMECLLLLVHLYLVSMLYTVWISNYNSSETKSQIKL